MSRGLRTSTVAFGLVVVTWGLLVFGASVRVNGAGLACPDWPLCFGEVIPEIDFGVFFEFGHRVYAGMVSLVFLALGALMAWRRVGRLPMVLWAIGLVVLGIQVVLGGLTVWELLAEWTVTSHLLAGNSFTLMVLLVGLALRAGEDGFAFGDPVSLFQRGMAALVAVMVPVQLGLGGLVSSSYAGLACPDWPTCAGDVWFPPFVGGVALQLTHRFVGYALAAAVLGMFAASATHKNLRVPAALVTALVVVQIGIGVGNVLLGLPIEVTLAHTGVGALIVLSTTWLNWRAFRSPLVSGRDLAQSPSPTPSS